MMSVAKGCHRNFEIATVDSDTALRDCLFPELAYLFVHATQ